MKIELTRSRNRLRSSTVPWPWRRRRAVAARRFRPRRGCRLSTDWTETLYYIILPLNVRCSAAISLTGSTRSSYDCRLPRCQNANENERADDDRVITATVTTAAATAGVAGLTAGRALRRVVEHASAHSVANALPTPEQALIYTYACGALAPVYRIRRALLPNRRYYKGKKRFF